MIRAVIGAVLLSAFAAFWLSFRYWPVGAPAEQESILAREIGAPSRANLIGVEPYLTPYDYRSADALKGALARYLDDAKQRGWMTDKTIVIFPEHVGSWLAAMDAPAAAYAAKTTTGAMIAVAGGDPVSFLKAYFRSHETDRAAAAIFRMRSVAMAAAYTRVFGGLARDYDVTIVAGSIVLQAPSVANGVVVAGRGPLYSAGAVFGPDGRAAQSLVVKVHPIPSEAGFSSGGDGDLPVFETPAGRLGVLICADSWHPALYQTLRDKGVDTIAAPAFLQPDGVWSKPWRGYVTPPPADLDTDDPGRLTEGEAWLKYALAGRLYASGAKAGLTAFLRGGLWDLGADGHAIARRGEMVTL
ncbi:MAG TPA: nitrilase-related carbon-nitrogen hydrolase, partial [Parvularculaceae bacterium]|nr:nitrilase-related carbon-nitrogen hydrolase [Parvularculaceae bacterium]